MASSASDKKRYYLDAMGIQVWQPRQTVFGDPVQREQKVEPLVSPTSEPRASAESAESDAVVSGRSGMERLDWQPLQEQVLNCDCCGLWQQRQHAVFGDGAVNADYMVIGAAPSALDDSTGKPFSGNDRKLPALMFNSIGVASAQLYLTQVVKCFPASGTVTENSVASCRRYLDNQIDLVEPRLLFVLGEAAAQFLLGSTQTITDFREKPFYYRGLPVVVSYHPDELLASPLLKRSVWQDLLRARQIVSGV